jgi:hypothetical protein
MATRQHIVVNQKSYEMAPDEILTVTVPVGTVSAQLPGQALTNWTLSAPTYSQKIEIVPESDPAPTQVARPISAPEAQAGATVPLPSRVIPPPAETTFEVPASPWNLGSPGYLWNPVNPGDSLLYFWPL